MVERSQPTIKDRLNENTMDAARKNFKMKERVKVMNNKTENIMRIIDLLECKVWLLVRHPIC